jgi:perosamine synthetase
MSKTTEAIPLSVPNLAGNEWAYIKDCLDTNWVSSVGSYVNQFEKITAEFVGSKYAVATSNGTSALHIALKLAGVGQGDLVIAPNITFVATINAIKFTGAKPILIDIDPVTWQMDLDLMEGFLEKNNQKLTIKAIMPVHVLGNMCDMDRLMNIAQKHNLQVIEDSTEALGSYYKGKHAGTFGTFGTLSYNGNKLITTGGGGMILTDDEVLAKRAKHITTTAKADPNEYYHDEVAYNYRLVNILAAMGVAQMEQLEGFLKRKVEIRDKYNEGLKQIEDFSNQKILDDIKPNNWLYTVKLPRSKELLVYLKSHQIEARPFWVPMNRLPANQQDMYIEKQDYSNQVYQNCVSLPCSTGISDSEIERVIELIKIFYQ